MLVVLGSEVLQRREINDYSQLGMWMYAELLTYMAQSHTASIRLVAQQAIVSHGL
jgi:hypothetical protein